VQYQNKEIAILEVVVHTNLTLEKEFGINLKDHVIQRRNAKIQFHLAEK